MTEQQLQEHDDLNQPIAQLLSIAKKRQLRQAEFFKLMQLLAMQRMISNGLGQVRFEELWPAYSGARPDAALLEGLFAPKLSELRRLIEELVLGQKRKVVIFSQWRRMLRLAEWSLRDILGDAGVRPVFFTGAESQKQRTRSIVEFHDDPNVRVMLLSDAGGVGLNLQRAASACINLELPWNRDERHTPSADHRERPPARRRRVGDLCQRRGGGFRDSFRRSTRGATREPHP